jgi:hypothetical protein
LKTVVLDWNKGEAVMTPELNNLVDKVQQNCHVSDAFYAGNYTMCIFLLKMREFYRWEQRIPLTETLPRKDVGDWLVAREQAWDDIETEAFVELPLNDQLHDPFDADGINHHLLQQGYVYSGGTGLYSKPHFFIGDVERQDRIDDITILVSGREHARDLVAPPSMYRGNTVFVRKESLRRFLWERIEDWRFAKGHAERPIGRALETYGKGRDLELVLDEMTDNETESLILHEVGESRAGKILGSEWEDMLTALPRTKLEFLARAARDLLADTLVTLPTLIEQDNAAALHVYFANFSGMRKHLAPGLDAAYRQWMASGNTATLSEEIRRGQDHWQSISLKALATFINRGPSARELIESELESAAI